MQLLIEFVDQVRCKKLRNNIRATVAIQVQQLSDKQDQLLAELKTWSENETTKFTQVEQLCDQVLDQTPTIGSSDEEPIPDVSNNQKRKKKEKVICRCIDYQRYMPFFLQF